MRLRIFGTWYGDAYDKMARVWRASLAESNPSAYVVMDRSQPSEELVARIGNQAAANTHKLGLWVEQVREAFRACEPIVLMDVDTIVLRDLKEAFFEFPTGADVAYTVRNARTPFNAGVVFCRPTIAAVGFMEAWAAVNDDRAAARSSTVKARKRNGGVNQDALSELLQCDNPAWRLGTLPCSVWNSVDQTWEEFDAKKTAVCHIKGNLRRACLGYNSVTAGGTGFASIVREYRRFEAALKARA
jgi:hypothetical protein